MPKDEIAIPSILKIERGVTAHIGDFLKEADITQVTILFGNGLTDMFGDTVFKSFKNAGVKMVGVNIKRTHNKVALETADLSKKIFEPAAICLVCRKSSQILTNKIYFVNAVLNKRFNFLYD